MTIRKISIYPDAVLKTKAAAVTKFDAELHRLLDDMAETMYEAPGIGLAAPQIAVLSRVAVVDVSEDRKGLLELINPRIISQSGETSSEEGCLSIPDYRDVVTRSAEIEVVAQNRKGEEFSLHADDLLAICLQHEIDHLDGTLFIDRLSYLKRQLFKKWFKKRGDTGA